MREFCTSGSVGGLGGQPRGSTRHLFGGVLTAIYGVLFTFLEAEDLALLGGTMLLVVALTVTMYFTRGIHRADEGRVCTDEQRAP